VSNFYQGLHMSALLPPVQTPVRLTHHDEQTDSTIANAYKHSKEFTKNVGLFEISPFFLMALGLQLGKPTNDTGQIVKGFGKFILVISPLIFVAKCLLFPVFLAGGLATAGTGAAHEIEKLFGKFVNPSPAERDRIIHTKHFVDRMETLLLNPDYTEEQKEKLEKNPEALVSLALLTIAFLSRSLNGEEIQAGDDVIKKSDVAKMDEHAQDYFARECRIKSNLQGLNLSPDNDHAWEYLLQSMKNFNDKRGSLLQHEQANIEAMCKECEELSSQIVQDKIFQTIWKA